MAAKAAVAQSDDMEDDFDFGDDAEIIAPKIDLRRKAKERRSKSGDIDPVAAAEAAMNDMSQKFSGWMTDGTETLISAWKACADADFTEDECTVFFARAHDIKGQAATLGFPAAGQVAASLCRLLELVTPTSRLPRELVRQHALAIRAIAQESTQNEPNALADTLAARLTSVTDEYLASLG
jgi:HPt (histidine-containing phosphotransfer) domain-containing protein